MSVKEMSEFTERNIGPGRRLYVALQEPGATVSWSKVGACLGALRETLEAAGCSSNHTPLTQGLVQLVKEQQKRLITGNGEKGVRVTPVNAGAAAAGSR